MLYCAQGDIEVKQVDLADLESVHRLTKDLLDSGTRLDMLILNAGVMACPLSYTKDGFEMQIGTNHLGHFALVHNLLPFLTSQVGAGFRIEGQGLRLAPARECLGGFRSAACKQCLQGRF